MESRSRPCLRASLASPLSTGPIQYGRHFDFSDDFNYTVKRIWSCILIQVSRVYVHRTKWQQKSVTSEPMMTRFIVACIHQASKIYEWNAKFNTLAAIFQTIFVNGFSWMKIYQLRLRFHWSLFLRVVLTIFQHWFRLWIGADQARSHYLNQLW